MSAVLGADPPLAEPLREQLAALEGFLTASTVDHQHPGVEVVSPNPEAAWERLEALPYYVQPRRHADRIADLRRQGLNAYGEPLTGDAE